MAKGSPNDSIIITELDCNHPGLNEKCVIFEGGKHEPEVNCVNYGVADPVPWRLECGNCFTVLKIFTTYDEAIQAGKEHAVDPSKHYPFDEEG